jgi:hypothetical protein
MERKLLAELNELLERAQRVLVEFLPPENKMTEVDALNELFDILDGPDQRRIQGEVRQLLAN